ncbi:MAG: adenine phosphoribosyltransferase [Elusimicrobiales bacterium]|nr:adenine phosphoribosyltransferase [Elusimicrobiales bacterium]
MNTKTEELELTNEIKKLIRDVYDFPKKGIIFKDIMPFLGDYKVFKQTINYLANHYRNKNISKVIGIEARGFILAAPLALEIGAGFVPVRKKGKLPYKTISVTYDLEYGKDTLEVHEDAIKSGENVIIVDDVLATGGTAKAVCDLVKRLNGNVSGVFMMIELSGLNGREKLKDYDLFSLIKY